MPIDQVKIKRKPAARKGDRTGRPTYRQNCQVLAAQISAASNHSCRRIAMAGSVRSTNNGTLVYSYAMTRLAKEPTSGGVHEMPRSCRANVTMPYVPSAAMYPKASPMPPKLAATLSNDNQIDRLPVNMREI